MRKGSILITGLLLVLILVGCDGKQALDLPENKNDVITEQTGEIVGTEKINYMELENVFGFADESTKRIITLQDIDGNKLEKPEEFNTAVGNNGSVIKIKFVKWQEANDKDNQRQTMYNFDNMAGYIYEVEYGEAIQNEVYFLSKDTVINESKLIKLKSTVNPDQDEEKYYKDVETATIEKIEAMKNRKIIKGDLLAETYESAKICLFLFERQGDDMLTSLAYIKNDKVIIKDYPAKYDEMSTWRVDAGDEPGLLKVLFLTESDEGLLLGMTWASPEGEGVFVLKEEGGAFQETDLKNGRYWSPM